CTTPSVGASGTITCTLSALANPGSVQVTIVVRPLAAAAGTTIVNTASVTANEFDPTAPNTQSASTIVSAPSATPTATPTATATAHVTAPDLTLSKGTDVSNGVLEGQGWNWTLPAANSGNAGAIFTAGTTLIHDDLDNSGGVTYGTPAVQNVTNVTNGGSIL